MKVANSYSSLLRGVSQQVSHDRAEGQHTEQINMLSDPVNGLVRRNGTTKISTALANIGSNQPADFADFVSWGKFDFTANGIDFLAVYRKGARAVDAATNPIWLFNKSTSIWFKLTANGTDTAYTTLCNGGISAITAVGSYLYLTGNTIPVTGIEFPTWDTAANYGKAVVWVRGGAYGRTFTIKVRLQNGTLKTVSYTTPLASYQGTLDTSGIPAAASDYTKQVNDAVNAYNSAVTAWIGTASEAIQPRNIALQLVGALSLPGVEGFGVSCLLVGSTIGFTGGNVKSVEVDDGGDGSLIRGVADEVESADKVSTLHFPGKIVKVRGKNSEEAYYLKAVSKDAIAAGLSEVTWVEGPGYLSGITGGFFMAKINATGNGGHIASTTAILNGLTGGSNPTFEASNVGDLDTNPPPFFMNKIVTYLGVFQNRLLVGCGGTLSVSETSSYLNFYRTTVLTLPASDAFEITPQSSDDETLKYGVLYDQNLVLFGTKRQYVLSGTTPMTPTAASMPVMSSYEGIVDTTPIAAGGLIFYAKKTDKSCAIFQIQPGDNFNSPSSFPVSSQLTDYISGNITSLTYLPGTPARLIATSSGDRHSCYVYTFLDTQEGRKLDSWSKWSFAQNLGELASVSTNSSGLLFTYLRATFFMGVTFSNIATDQLKLDTTSNIVHLDSAAPCTVDSTLYFNGGFRVCYSSGPRYMLSEQFYLKDQFILDNGGDFENLWFGAEFESSVTMTNPVMRDSKGKAITTGKLTVGQMNFSFSSSGGFNWQVKNILRNTTSSGDYLGAPRPVTSYDTETGTPVFGNVERKLYSGSYAVTVAQETRNFTIKIKARNEWPLNITAVEWSGQFFNRVQRF